MLSPCNRVFAVLFASMVALFMLATPAWAQTTFTKPIRLIVPYPPGGGTDVVARTVARRMSENIGQQVIVENKPGALSTIGTDLAARAAPDGYTIVLVTDHHPINFAFKRTMPYKVSDFTPIIHLINVPLALLVNTNVPVKTFDELISYSRANPGKLTFASLGPASPHEMAMLWLNKLANTDIRVIPYSGTAPALTAVLGGQVDLMFMGTAFADSHIKAGKLRALAISAARRTAGAPDLPAIAERYPDYSVTSWYGILAPAGLPPAIATRLHAELSKALEAEDVKRQIEATGAEVIGGTPADFDRTIQRDIERWSGVIQLTGAKPE